jgi:carbamoyltransferase
MKSLGISPFHDSSVCLYEDGKITSFYKEERLTRVKRAKHPYKSLDAALKGVDNVDVLVFCPPIQNETTLNEFVSYAKTLTKFEDILDLSSSHHLQHASLAFYNSGFKEAAVIVIDRNGSDLLGSCRESESIFIASYPANFVEVYKSYWAYNNLSYLAQQQVSKNNPECEIEIRSNFGITKVYETATSLIKQHALENGKTMGLSAYGNKDLKFVDLFINGTSIPNDYHFSHTNLFDNYESIFTNFYGKENKDITVENHQFYADYAWQVQKQTQEAVCHLIEKAVSKSGLKNICITGGYGLNVVANAYFTENYPEINFYFEPLADDSGNSIGGAMLGYRLFTGDSEIRPLLDTFFHGTVASIPKKSGTKVTEAEIARLLVSHKVIATLGGKAEAGPRALGNRSILFYPDVANAKEIVNLVKNREWYRPFAAAVLEEDADKLFFMNGGANEFMTSSFTARPETRLLFPGVVHVDGTCRVQTVSKSSPLHSLLVEIKKITGTGLVLNTSFNLAGEPLVDSYEDAIRTFNNSSIDVLWFLNESKALSK